MIDDQAQALSVRLLAGGDHSSFTRDHVLCGIERETAEMPETSDFATIVQGTMCLGCILNQLEIVELAHLLHSLHIEWLTVEMDTNNGTRSRGHPLFELSGINIERLLIDITEDRFGPTHQDRRCGGNEREGWDNDLVAMPDVRCKESRVKGSSPVVHCDRMGGAAIVGKLCLQFPHFFTGSEHS